MTTSRPSSGNLPCAHLFADDLRHPGYESCMKCHTFHSKIAALPGDLYTADYWTHANGHSTLEEQIFNCADHEENGRTKVRAILDAIGSQSRCYALEIGCAPGVLLGALKRDAGFYSVIGIEMCSELDAEIRRVSKSDEPIFYGEFPGVTADKPGAKMNLIVASDVLEHSHEPMGFLMECRRLLSLDGQLILMLPIACADMPERMFAPEEHVYLHTFRNLTAMMRSAGLHVDNIGRWCAGHEIISAHRTDRGY